ncbi:hypothetical protein TSOC_012421 [Tetrabaena socialis]|uniref:PSI domain-containing protein n=1 Tax=Tetrabaena socialis TaxID=47790 RepID=A0A2J7ZN47_9CHLO|nr:hypothetical protein TSOC_012421 [Tetrabaena socialis]|eukprot:PNH01676.1 hypothetical protein TSOC_012421 [Tetrabaena socialis]
MRPSSLLAACVLIIAGCSAARLELPGSVQSGPLTCVKTKTPIECDLLDNCVWCSKSGTKWGTGCYPIAAARLLPAKWGVECDKDLSSSPPPATPAEDPAAQQPGEAEDANGVCDGKAEAVCVGPECVWCSSAAVGGGCYTPAEAKLLPKAIFTCKNAPSDSHA